MTIETIRDMYESKMYNTKLEYPDYQEYDENYVFDENKSVKWNREEVIHRNNERKDLITKLRNDQNRLDSKLHDDVVTSIMESLKISNDKASKIKLYAYDEKHSFMSDYFGYVEDLIDLISEIIK